MRNLLIALALVASGCISAPDRSVSEIGIGSSSLLSKKTLEGNVPLDSLVRSRTGVEWEVFGEPDGVAFDVGLGLHTYRDNDQPGWVGGIDTTFKLTFGNELVTEPYVIFSASMDRMSRVWNGTDVDYTFTNTFGFGLSHYIGGGERIFLDYRWFHTSNGSTFHSDSFRDALGLTKSEENPGFEAGLITLGYSFEF